MSKGTVADLDTASVSIPPTERSDIVIPVPHRARLRHRIGITFLAVYRSKLRGRFMATCRVQTLLQLHQALPDS